MRRDLRFLKQWTGKSMLSGMWSHALCKMSTKFRRQLLSPSVGYPVAVTSYKNADYTYKTRAHITMCITLHSAQGTTDIRTNYIPKLQAVKGRRLQYKCTIRHPIPLQTWGKGSRLTACWWTERRSLVHMYWAHAFDFLVCLIFLNPCEAGTVTWSGTEQDGKKVR